MPRRIIYIQNPTSGSHFRTVGDGPPKSGRERIRQPYTIQHGNPAAPTVVGSVEGNTYISTSGARYSAIAPDWAINNNPNDDFLTPKPQSYALPDYGIGPYQQEFIDEFQPASTFIGMMYDMALHMDPFSGTIAAPYGTPGTLKHNYMTGNVTQFGGKFAKLPSRYTGLHPKRLNPRPWWAR